MTAIQHEIELTQTYLTIAKLAYDMGQLGRGDWARARACEASSDAARLRACLPASAPTKLDETLQMLQESLNTISPDGPAFAAPLRQPSMS